jgi:hypothetical protein
MKTKAAMCCVAMPVQPMSDSGQTVRFAVSAAYPISGVISENAGLHAQLFALRKQAALLHDGVALTTARPW